MNITEQQVRDFIANAAAELAVETNVDRVYVACSCCIIGTAGVTKSWSISAGNLSQQFSSETLQGALANMQSERGPAGLVLRAAELRRQADELEARATAIEPVAP